MALEKHTLNNDFRVRKYFWEGIDLASLSSDAPLTEHWPGLERPFLFSEKAFDGVAVGEFPEGVRKYIADMRHFVESVNAEIPLPVQFDDNELPNSVPSGLVFKKARAINGKGILLKLKVGRHWHAREEFDRCSWDAKRSEIVWRGQPTGHKDKGSPFAWSRNVRFLLVSKYHSLYNVGFSSLGRKGDLECEPYVREPLTIEEQLKHKYVISLQGNDVATNLKWILASNSVPIMPPPTVETWLLESQLEPYVHYVPMSDDMKNLPATLEWCRQNDDACRDIAENGQNYIRMFFDTVNEAKIYTMIYDRYRDLIA
ncbi:glycosyl transferase family 90 [Aquibaculum arenosum]|uniref:Glycosyl transferase family 90 n=1 Tax=Aquibaculum arenosum TaxID=3032591 RepID=A0ABT5YPK3_9PROT|nr:glycosyl transferase family 90 [Fodinicurvata sp. CAU 1616]MDF2096144.1 glycosyl transferase family 90 [Fodinicurvata sp. CAU 1616]